MKFLNRRKPFLSDSNDNQTGGFGQRDNTNVQRPIVPKIRDRKSLRPEPGVPRPKKQRSKGCPQPDGGVSSIFMMSLLVLVVLGAGMAFYLGKQKFDEAGPLIEAKKLHGPPKVLAYQRFSQSLETQWPDFPMHASSTGPPKPTRADKQMKAGEYEIKAGASMREIMEILKKRQVGFSIR